MSANDTGQLIYLVLLGCAILGYYLVSHRNALGQMARHAALWGLIFIGVIAAVGLWSDISRDVFPRQSVFAEAGRIEVPQAQDGHYYMVLEANGESIDFVVDTGATDIVLNHADARRVGLNPDELMYTGVAGTANGIVRTARVTLDTLTLGPFTDRAVPVWVTEGEMRTSLLGMAYLRQFERLEISGGQLVLER